MKHTTLSLILLAIAAPLAAAQPVAPLPIPEGDSKPAPEKPAPPAFDQTPAQVQRAAKGFDPRLTNFTVTDKLQVGGVMWYMVTGEAPGLSCEMRIIESGTVMSAKLYEESSGEAPPELRKMIDARYGKNGEILNTRKISVTYIEPHVYIKVSDAKDAEIRNTYLNSTLGAVYQPLNPGEVVPSESPLPALTAEERSASDKALAGLPEPVRAAVKAYDPKFDRFSTDELSIESALAFQITAESPDRKATLLFSSEGTLLSSDEVTRTVSVAPPEFDVITKRLYPKSTPLVRRQRLARTFDYGTVVKTKGERLQFILRNFGRIEVQPDNQLKITPAPRPAK